jgi:glutamate synthase domain-containing protein 3
MSGGEAYVLDPDAGFPQRCNTEMVAPARSLSLRDAGHLKRMIEWHRDATGSARAAEVLENWNAFLPLFWKVSPRQAVQQPAATSAVRSRPRPAAGADETLAAAASREVPKSVWVAGR